MKDTNTNQGISDVDRFVSHLESASKTVESWPEWKKCIITSSDSTYRECGVGYSKSVKET